jgi:hypothetical protein
VVPDRQGLPLTTQAAPATHGAHAPAALHTRSAPHAVPAARLVPLSMHWDVPPVQVKLPAWHALVGVQAAPAGHLEEPSLGDELHRE